MNEQILKSIAGGYGRGTVPGGIEILTGGMYPTKDAVNMHIWGWSRHCRALIDWDVVPRTERLLDNDIGIKPVLEFLWLTRPHARPGTFMQPAVTFVDACWSEFANAAVAKIGGVEKALGRYRHRIFDEEVVMGQSWSKTANGRKYNPVPVALFNANAAKSGLLQSIPLKLRLPENVPAEILEQLCSEACDDKGHWRAVPGRPGIALHCHNLARAAFVKLRQAGNLQLAA